ncbi:hypothetical protein SAMN04487944_13013 [Gracilibacillus ureilyticus]|uniref:Uncharacterized protein n=1 Tax=Gracilibacillus ureilyticus TaxID=531814 RepID=A0A1H9VZE3_9BACI|nr:hypothetical protein [Gracilibacillus ureilyticus]SES26747.1 hypothetical protein SAMN04487944_13013 [Gracilibacillus ureilyticus]
MGKTKRDPNSVELDNKIIGPWLNETGAVDQTSQEYNCLRIEDKNKE